MSWTQKTVPAPLVDGVEDLANSISSVTQPVITLLNQSQTLLDQAKKFIVTEANPTTALALQLIEEVEKLNNDIFGSGVFQLVVQPFEFAKVDDPLGFGDDSPFDVSVQQTGGNRPDDFGIPLLPPADLIDEIIRSFDDAGDTERPQFSENASVAAFGFLITAPTANGFIGLLEQLTTVWDLGPFARLLEKMKANTNRDTGGSTPVASSPPDWDSVRFNSIGFLRKTQDEINKQLNMLQGLIGAGDSIVDDFLRVIERKLNTLQSTINDFNSLINEIKNATPASGVYVLDIPEGVGGNERLKQEIQDDQFNKLNHNLSAAVIYVGGGASVASIESIRKLVT